MNYRNFARTANFSSKKGGFAPLVFKAFALSAVLIMAFGVLMSASAHNHSVTPTIVSAASGNWSNPAVWSPPRVPAAGDVVKISSGIAVTYNVWNEADIEQVIVEGSLIFSRSVNTNLDTGSLIVNPKGHLEIGTASSPIPVNIKTRIRLTDNAVKSPAGDPNNMHAMSQGALMVMGQAEIHGAPKTPFVKLGATAPAGASSVTLISAPVGWSAGDEIVLGGVKDKSETRTIKSVSGSTIQLTSPLSYAHSVIAYTSPHDGKTFQFRHDVGNLTRNIKITSKYPDTARGHTMIMDMGLVMGQQRDGANWRISYVEYRDLGGIAQPFNSTDGRISHIQPLLGRYPVHFHLLGTVSQSPATMLSTSNTLYVKGVAISGSQNHALTIHGSDRVLIEDNIAHDSLGHAFNIGEDGSEMENVVRNNFTVKTTEAWDLRATPDDPKIAYWEQNVDAAGIWFGNMGQLIYNNVASDVKVGYGMYKIRPTPPNRLLGNVEVETNDIPIKLFADNETYGCSRATGLYHFVGTNAGEVKNIKVWGCAKGLMATTSETTHLAWNGALIADIKSIAALLTDGQDLINSRIIMSLPGGSTSDSAAGISIEKGNVDVVNTIVEAQNVPAVKVRVNKSFRTNNFIRDSVLLGSQPASIETEFPQSGSFISVFNYRGSRMGMPKNFKLVPLALPLPDASCIADSPMNAWICPQ